MKTPNVGLFFAVCLVVSFVACKKETTFKYKATCDNCKISYYDENGTFVVREDHQGTFEKEISVEDFSPVMIAVKSSACPETTNTTPTTTTCDSALFVNDVIMVELWKSGEQINTDTSMGKPEQAISFSYDWQK
jgi:hypothetical protein